MRLAALVLLLLALAPAAAAQPDARPSARQACEPMATSCGRDSPVSAHLDRRIAPPPGFVRAQSGDPFGEWLRHLPLRPGRPEVRLFDGTLKARQDVQAAVIDLDVGTTDLQQCADTILRLRAEWLRSEGATEALAFRFTSGDLSRWTDWAAGLRPRVSGSKVTFVKVAAPDASRASFRQWLDSVFTYAGTLSLRRDLRRVAAGARIEPGDVFVQGGSPGHAMIVIDVARNPQTGERLFLLAQGFMPAQDAHVVVNPATPGSPWYPERFGETLQTPEWTFVAGDRRRF